MSDLSLDPILPQWWDDQITASWHRQREAALADWAHTGDRTVPLDRALAAHALAFGHGGRRAFPACATWDSVAGRLKADWIHLGNVGTAAWDKVVALVRHEWLRAAGPGGDASPDSTGASA